MSSAAGRAVDAAGNLEGYEIFLKYLPTETTEADLRAFFAPAGEIVGDARLMTHPQTGKCKGIGWITFATQEGLTEALRWDNCRYNGRNISITPAKAVHHGIRPSLQAPGTHTPALLREVISKMVGPEKNAVYVDATFGRGGHSRGILDALGPTGQLHAFDMDPEAITAGKELAAADKRFFIHHAPFSAMESTLRPMGVQPAGVFFDLGISSPQFDEAHRGFRPEADGPLDLRFDQTTGQPAWQFLQGVPRGELIRILHEYGETTDEVAARRIADAICLARERGALPRRTKEFASLVADAKGKEYQAMHPAKLAFQALRIHLNDEFGEMRRGMSAAFALLKEGGRIGLITWKHSECAIVVDFFRQLEAVRSESPLYKWYGEQQASGRLAATPKSNKFALVMDDTTRPSEQELKTNSRSRSALLHVLRKRRVPRMAEVEAAAYASLGWTAVKAAAREPLPEVSTEAATGDEASATKDLTKAERKALKQKRREEKDEKKRAKKRQRDDTGKDDSP